MSQWEIKDPWPTRIRERLARALICTWRGHKRQVSFSRSLKACNRCGQ